MGDEFEYVVVDNIDKEIRDKVVFFRRNTSSIEGRVRTDAECVIHEDKYCSDRDIKKWVLVFDKEVIIGMAAVFLREIMFLDRNIKLGGIGKVRVTEHYRNKGIASKMMKKVMEQLHNIGADIALLCTNTDSFLVDFYRKYGFELLGRPYMFKGKSGKDYGDEEGMLAPIHSIEIYNLVMQSNELLDIGVGNW